MLLKKVACLAMMPPPLTGPSRSIWGVLLWFLFISCMMHFCHDFLYQNLDPYSFKALISVSNSSWDWRLHILHSIKLIMLRIVCFLSHIQYIPS